MKGLRKTVRCLDRAEDILVFLLCMAMFLVGLYALYDSYLVYKGANDTSLLKYKPNYEGEAPDKPIEGNMVAWLTIDDTLIDYPVMQGETNTEYLNKDPFGDYSLSGSIFLDSRNAPDFSDDYSLVYGHHMEGGLMFGALDKYLDKAYFDAHRTGTLIVGDKTYQIQIFAVLEAEATNKEIFAPTEIDSAVTLDYVKKHAVFIDDAAAMKGKIFAMSTCKYPDTVDRTIVLGTLTP